MHATFRVAVGIMLKGLRNLRSRRGKAGYLRGFPIYEGLAYARSDKRLLRCFVFFQEADKEEGRLRTVEVSVGSRNDNVRIGQHRVIIDKRSFFEIGKREGRGGDKQGKNGQSGGDGPFGLMHCGYDGAGCCGFCRLLRP